MDILREQEIPLRLTQQIHVFFLFFFGFSKQGFSA